ncbi:hypothetical protein G9A89_004877 [Geosiphon pyriformis]|nr:hypothetical protein G9A89_004877 [Geosiphon pyriformis]
MVGSFAGGSGTGLAELGFQSESKKKARVESVYARDSLYKKSKKPIATGIVVDLSAEPIPENVLQMDCDEHKVFWDNKVESEDASISEVSDVENMGNMVTEETSYVDSNTYKTDDIVDDATPRKTQTKTYILRLLLKTPSFRNLSDDDAKLVLPKPKFAGFNQLLSANSHVLESCSFKPVRLFALDVDLAAVSEKTNGDKLMAVKKIFYQIDGFGGASTLLKFSGIIKSFFTSKLSLKKTKKLAIHEKIVVNNDVRQKILVDLPKSAVESVFFKFRKILIQLLSSVALTIEDKQSWIFRDQHRALFYTLPVGTTTHDLFGSLELYSEKICFIDCNSSSYVCNRCVVICFENEASKLVAIAGLSLTCCTKYKQFGHISDMCSVGKNSGIRGKQVASIIRPVFFGGKTWVQVVDSFFSFLGFSSPLSAGLSSGAKSSIGAWSFFNSADPHGVSSLFDHLAFLKWFLELLTDQVSDIVRKLSFVKLVPLPSVSYELPLAVSTTLASEVILDMVLDGAPEPFAPSLSAVVDDTSGFSSSSSKILTTKFSVKQIGLFVFWLWLPITFFILMSGLVWKIAACNIRGINVSAKQVDVTKLKSSSELWIKDKYDGVQIFTSGLDVGHFGADVAVVMNNSLAHHVSKIEIVPGWVISVHFLFKSKLSVSVLSLYAGVSADIHFGQDFEVNSIIAKTVNTSTFVVLGGDFNESGSGKSVSFKFCLSLDLVNLFNGHYLIKTPTWCNSRGAERIIDYIFISESLFSAVVKHWVSSVSDFFDTDHNAVVVSVGLGGLLDVQLNGLHKQANKNHWKFKIKNVNSAEWFHFRDCFSARILMIKNRFFTTAVDHNLDVIWSLLEGVLVNSADKIFSRLWFSDFQCSKNKQSSKFLELEFLVAKIVKRLESGDTFRFDRLVEKWSTLDADKALVLRDIVYADCKIINILKYLSTVRKKYRKSKMYESKLAQKASIRAAIKKYIEKFCLDKGSMIRSVLNRPFQKVVLDHLVVDDKLVLDSDGVRLNVDRIMEGWTRKYVYALLNYVKNNAFSGVIDAIGMSELFVVVGGLSDGKATGFVMKCLLVLLNKCFFVGMVPALWKKAWVLMIPKPYDWNRILTNTHSIALIETARKILFDRISFTCSKFGVLHDDNFLVLKGTSTQVLVFAVGSVVYDSVDWYHLKTSLWHIKMCGRFIKFFGSIYEDRINRIMTNFGLSNDYRIHDGLDQSEVFSLFLWRIFYDLLLCEVKRHLYGYRINTKFVAKLGRIESGNIASNFFSINDISINSKKTVAIPINQGVKVASLDINRQPISIAKRGKAHRYLGIFLLTEDLSRPSLAKAHLDVHFFANIVLRKAITDKQFSYLVLAVLQPIVNYHTQFNALVRKGLKLKAGLLYDFSDAALHHLLLYGLKSFEQIQAKSKLAAVVMFSNALGILGYLFNHRFLDLQILGWAPLDPLQFPVKLHVSSVNNFLAGMVKIFLGNELSLANNLSCAFCNPGNFPMLLVLESAFYFGSVCSLKQFSVVFGDRLLDKKGRKRLDSRGFVFYWFNFTSGFLHDGSALLSGLARTNQLFGLDILASKEFSDLHSSLHKLQSGLFEIFTDGLLKDFGSFNVAGSAAKYFSAIDCSIGVRVRGLMSSTLAKLQTVALALECVPSSSAITIHLDSQAVINTCVSELFHLVPDFRVPFKNYSGVYGNIKADTVAGAATCSQFFLPIGMQKWLLIAKSMVVSDNAHHFVRDLFRSEAGPSCNIIQGMWHPDLHMLTGSTSQKFSVLQLYLIKAKLYDKNYPGVLCLLCREVELPNHVFFCAMDAGVQEEIFAEAAVSWVSLVSFCVLFSSAVLQFLGCCSLDVGLYLCLEAVGVFEVKKMAVGVVVNFVRSIVKLYHSRVWLVRSSYRMNMKKASLVGDNGVISGLSCCKISVLFNDVVRMLGILDSFSVSFGCHRPKLFFSGLDFNPHVIVDM